LGGTPTCDSNWFVALYIKNISVDSLKTEVAKRHVRHGFNPLFFFSLAVIVVVAGAARLLPIIFY
jgi:hypothetical protein